MVRPAPRTVLMACIDSVDDYATEERSGYHEA